MSNKTSKVDLSTNVTDMVNLAQKVYHKHTSEGATSPMNSIQGIDMEAFNALNLEILSIHNEAEDLRKRSEQLHGVRDNKLVILEDQLRQIKNLLKAIHKKNTKELGLWGFDVIDSSKGKSGTK